MKRVIDYFRKMRKPSQSALIAKERLQIIVAHESVATDDPDFIRKLQDEMLDVICKYININRNQVRVQLEQRGEHSVLELNVTLDEAAAAAEAKSLKRSSKRTISSKSSSPSASATSSEPSIEEGTSSSSSPPKTKPETTSSSETSTA